MSETQTWEWPPEMAEALRDLNQMLIRNPNPGRKIEISNLGDPLGEASAVELGS